MCLVVGSFAAPTQASDRVYKKRSADGTVVFSDAPLNKSGQRTAYTTAFGRPQATASCQGQTPGSLQLRKAELNHAFELAARTTGLDINLLTAVARVESCFDPKARSSAGAEGVMQLMPGTARELGVTNSMNASSNIMGGARYLAKMLTRHDGDLTLALASYNAGPGAVDRHGGVPPYPETQAYVAKVTKQLAQNRRNGVSG